jgi:hypothetical protein
MESLLGARCCVGSLGSHESSLLHSGVDIIHACMHPFKYVLGSSAVVVFVSPVRETNALKMPSCELESKSQRD